jgi:hypothetical protein
MSKQIRLINTALSATVDDDMYDELTQWDWYLLPAEGTHYAARDVIDEDGNRSVVLMHLQVLYPKDPYRWRVNAETRAAPRPVSPHNGSQTP